MGSCGGEPVLTAEVLYVSVALGENVPMETPAEIREHLGEAVDLFATEDS